MKTLCTKCSDRTKVTGFKYCTKCLMKHDMANSKTINTLQAKVKEQAELLLLFKEELKESTELLQRIKGKNVLTGWLNPNKLKTWVEFIQLHLDCNEYILNKAKQKEATNG